MAEGVTLGDMWVMAAIILAHMREHGRPPSGVMEAYAYFRDPANEERIFAARFEAAKAVGVYETRQ